MHFWLILAYFHYQNSAKIPKIGKNRFSPEWGPSILREIPLSKMKIFVKRIHFFANFAQKIAS